MSKIALSILPMLLASLATPLPSSAQQASPSAAAAAPAGRDWLTWGYDGERTGWNRAETSLTKENVSRLALKWNTQVGTAANDIVLSTLTAPLVVEGAATPQGPKNLLFVLGADGALFALDADNGKIFWQKAFPNTVKPQRAGNINCSNTVQATPVIDKPRGLIFFTSGDGKLHGLTLAAGKERLTPLAMVAPYSRSWSLNLIDNVVYISSGRGCGNGNPVEWGGVSAVDVSDLAHPQLSRFNTSQGRAAGPWGRGGPVKGPKGVYVQTADGPTDPGAGVYGEAVVAVLPKAYGLADTFVPSNWRYLNSRDLDFGSGSPVIFPFGKRTLAATGAKEGVLYVLDANNLGGGAADHSKPLYQTPRLGNDAQSYFGQGIWGGLSTYENAQGERFVYTPVWGPAGKDAPTFKYAYGATPHGSVMAFQVAAEGDGIALKPQWISRDLFTPDSVAVANGVVYAVQTGEQTMQHPDNPEGHGKAVGGGPALTLAQLGKFRSTPVATMTLYALDAETGKELYSSQNAMNNYTHFSEPVVALGKVFVVSHDSHVYAFGLK